MTRRTEDAVPEKCGSVHHAENTLRYLFLEVSQAKLMFHVWISEFRGMGWKGEFKRIAVLIGNVWTTMQCKGQLD